jgi:hypothetical protein
MTDTPPPPDSDPQIKQDVTGDQNQVIGQIRDSIFVNQLTIHERIPSKSVPIAIEKMQLTQDELDNRKLLLNRVKNFWIKGVLETSLHTRALIELGLQERLDLVQRPFSEESEFVNFSGQVLPENNSTNTFFEQMGEERTLLILGEPGAGKTVTLLKLAEDLIIRTASDLRQSIPVVFTLSSWARKSQAIEQWLVQELVEKYKIPKAVGKEWVEKEALILLLDGLDEVKIEQRNTCVKALNKFMQTHGRTEVVICSRIRDYEALADRLKLRSAIYIQSLTDEQITFFLEQAGEQLNALKTVLRQDVELQKLATSPLILSIMSLAYQDYEIAQIALDGESEDYRKHLLENYINRMLQRRGTTQKYLREDTQRWLVYIAQQMTAESQTMFLIERLQPSWLPTKKQRIRYRRESALLGGLSIVLIYGLIYILFALIYSLINLTKFTPTEWIKDALIGGASYGISFSLTINFLGEIKPIETLEWSWQKTKNSFAMSYYLVFFAGIIFVFSVSFLGLIYDPNLITLIQYRHGSDNSLHALFPLILILISTIILGFMERTKLLIAFGEAIRAIKWLFKKFKNMFYKVLSYRFIFVLSLIFVLILLILNLEISLIVIQFLCLGLIFLLVLGSLFGLFFGLTGGGIGTFSVSIYAAFMFLKKISSLETAKINREDLDLILYSEKQIRGFQKGFVYGLIYGLTLVFLTILSILVGEKEAQSLSHQLPLLISGPFVVLILGLFSGLLFGLFGGLLGALFGGFSGIDLQEKEKPNQGIFRSVQNAAILGISLCVIGGIIGGIIGALMGKLSYGLGYGLFLGMRLGLIAGLVGGGSACIRHLTLRFMLYRKGLAPWNYARFLDYTTDRLFLQKVGGGYIFVHRILMEHFAEMSLERKQR